MTTPAGLPDSCRGGLGFLLGSVGALLGPSRASVGCLRAIYSSDVQSERRRQRHYKYKSYPQVCPEVCARVGSHAPVLILSRAWF
eukprot:5282968-Pyramimonas_sp.AAC.1